MGLRMLSMDRSSSSAGQYRCAEHGHSTREICATVGCSNWGKSTNGRYNSSPPNCSQNPRRPMLVTSAYEKQITVIRAFLSTSGAHRITKVSKTRTAAFDGAQE